MFTHQRTLRITGLAAAAALVATLAACSSDDTGSSDPSSAGSGEALTALNFWDPYPQHDDASDWEIGRAHV